MITQSHSLRSFLPAILAALAVAPGTVPAAAPTAVSSPAEGFGSDAKGGAGGQVIEVTSLADSGPGSLRAALATQGPRLITFAVAGTIPLESRLRCTSGQVTLDGSSAPGTGITLLNHGIQFRGDCDDIIVRELRIRVTTGGAEGDCLLFWGTEGGAVERVLVDHCSLMGATDEVVNTWGQVRDVTVQWSIVAQARPPHGKGWLSGVGSDRISIHHCLFAGNADRNPKLEGGLYDVVNNVVWGWSQNNAVKIGSGARVNLVDNVFLPSPQSKPSDGCVFPADREAGTRVYLSGNIGPATPTGAGDQWQNVTAFQRHGERWVAQRPAPAEFRAEQPFPVAPVVACPAPEALAEVLAQVGPRDRDADDRHVVEEVRNAARRAGLAAGR
jgi:pectate lyase